MAGELVDSGFRKVRADLERVEREMAVARYVLVEGSGAIMSVARCAVVDRVRKTTALEAGMLVCGGGKILLVARCMLV